MSPLLLYLWIWFSNNCIHNAFLAVVEDGYILQSQVSTFSWLTDDLQDPDNNKIIGADEDSEPELTSEQFINNIRKLDSMQGEEDSEDLAVK